MPTNISSPQPTYQTIRKFLIVYAFPTAPNMKIEINGPTILEENTRGRSIALYRFSLFDVAVDCLSKACEADDESMTEVEYP
mmetsp:Transcript_15607/g.27637  ORF Transcript_15607/g.27637 Transcript_15607/m.27637 type:complete len:82 (+) Transcript_15607:1213-1458(+)